jgi:hypothetical protein
MKKQKLLLLCAVATLCLLFPSPLLYATDVTRQEKTGEVATEQTETTKTDEAGAETYPALSETETPTETKQPTETETPTEAPTETETLTETEQPTETETPAEPEKVSIPQKVTGLSTTVKSKTRVILRWQKSEAATSYKIYRKVSGNSYKKLGETKKTSYTDKTIVYGKTYTYKVIPFNKEEKAGKASTITLKNTQAVNILSQKYTYKQMKTDMKELAAKYSDYCTMTSIGTSVQGRAIYDLAIGNPEAKQSVLVVSTLHAREYICVAVLMRQIEYYLANYSKSLSGTKPSEVLKNLQVHYIVMANPDGVTISQTSKSRWKANANGVDLNRNFPAVKFVAGGTKGAEGYSGKAPLSEPETKAIANFTIKLQKEQGLLGVVNYHAMGQIVFGDSTSKKLRTTTTAMYRIARNLTGYASASGYSSSNGSYGGQYREYVMYVLGIPSISLEIGTTAAPCSYREYGTQFNKNKLVVLKISEALIK